MLAEAKPAYAQRRPAMSQERDESTPVPPVETLPMETEPATFFATLERLAAGDRP